MPATKLGSIAIKGAVEQAGIYSYKCDRMVGTVDTFGKNRTGGSFESEVIHVELLAPNSHILFAQRSERGYILLIHVHSCSLHNGNLAAQHFTPDKHI